ncbi:hypothetical protein RF55_15657 [Lasius niger]|uniref:RNA-directed DNA polymerase n=1 Tax=Lasius niger TaxID=67767 RepID=A0A0J7K5Y0_LASNI|nr:hypothetical protein RF55_15657 [Lasius niger]
MLRLTLKENAKPVALKVRHVAFALRDKVEAELTRLISLGHLEKAEVSEWATPIVPILKSDGSVRICGDFKLTVNPCLVIDRHPLPLIDEIFANLQGGKTFSQLDLAHAYMQVNVDEASRDCLTIITHKGLFRYTKLPEGVASGPTDFQKKMEMCLAGIPKVSVYLDNIFCTGTTDKEHRETLEKVCRKLQDCGLRVSKKKCEFFKKELDILGFIIDKDGLRKAPSKVTAMLGAPRPIDGKQLASFLGLVTYYSRFLPQRADKLKPLYECARADKFLWTPECDRAFEHIKKELASERVLAHYDPKQNLVLACDASTYGLAAVLSHEYPDGTERPIAFASKLIPKQEFSRAILDKEAGAIVFGLRKFYNYLIGRKFTLKTDHKPLTFIFGPRAEIPATIASRLQRWAYFLSGFNFQISYVKSAENSNCDALSRLPVADDTPVFDPEFNAINFIESGSEMLKASDIAIETDRDAVLREVAKYVREGWPSTNTITPEARKFEAKGHELSIEKKCLFWGNRVVTPTALRAPILRELHASHVGMSKMKMTARSYVWWPGINSDIENIANACRICLAERKQPAKVPLTPWPWPDKPWTRIHSDFLGPLAGHMFLIVVDAHSKWSEAIDMGSNTQAGKTIIEFRKLFARFGLPRHVVTDNGRQYASNEFRDFLARHGIKQTFTSPYHPATNGAAENFVGTFKDKITKIMKEGKSLEHAVNLFLFDYRSKEHCTTKRSPAWMMLKRELHTRFDLLKPCVADDVEKSMQAQIAATDGKRRVSPAEGDAVMVDDHTVRGPKRVEAKITKKLLPVTYEIGVGSTK